MSILDQYGNPVSSASRHFATGADRSDRGVPPQPLFKEDIEKLIPSRDRESLVSGSRKLFQNYGPILGAMQQKADNAVGRAWAPKFTGQDREWGKLAKEWLETQWYGFCDLRGRGWDFKTLLWLDSIAIDRDGDFLILLTESASGYPLTQRIPANRIGQRWAGETVPQGKTYAGAKCSHGIIRDRNNRALAYMVLGDTAADDQIIPADRVIHAFDPLWHDQVRGIPSFSHAIKQALSSFTATEREQLNQLIRSSIALIEYNDQGAPDMDNPAVQMGGANADGTASPTIEHFAAGMVKYIRSNSGGKLEALDNDTPGDMWDRFQDRVVRNALCGFNWPYELVWKANEINAALVRNIQERARKSVEDRQDVLKGPATFAIRYAVAKAIKIGILPKPKNTDDWWRWDFQMPAKFSVDAGKDAQQRREDFRIGYRSRRDIAEEEGRDVENIEDTKIDDAFRFEKKIQEREKAEGIQIDRRQLIMMTPNETPVAEKPTGDPEKDPDDETKDEEEE